MIEHCKAQALLDRLKHWIDNIVSGELLIDFFKLGLFFRRQRSLSRGPVATRSGDISQQIAAKFQPLSLRCLQIPQIAEPYRILQSRYALHVCHKSSPYLLPRLEQG